MRELEVLGNGHLMPDFADWKGFFETAMSGQVRPASEAGRSYRLLQAKYCRAVVKNPSSFPLFFSCAQ
jgi:hypothetical protein